MNSHFFLDNFELDVVIKVLENNYFYTEKSKNNNDYVYIINEFEGSNTLSHLLNKSNKSHFHLWMRDEFLEFNPCFYIYQKLRRSNTFKSSNIRYF